MAEPALRLCADAGLSFEVTERSLVAVRERAGRPAARPSERHPRVRSGRRRRPRYHRREPRRRGGGRRRHDRGARLRSLRARGRRACGRAAAGDRRSGRPARRDGVPGVDEATARRAWCRLRARARLGSVEAAPRLGLADAIVDLVSTGSTMAGRTGCARSARLSSQAVLVGGTAAVERGRDLVERLELMLSGVVSAWRRRYVMMNAHVDDLPAIRALLPGMGAPSVLQLADEANRRPWPSRPTIWNLLPCCATRGRRRSSCCRSRGWWREDDARRGDRRRRADRRGRS